MAAPIFPESTLTLTSLQDPSTPSLLDIRPYLSHLRTGPEYSALVQIQQAFDNLQEVLRSTSPDLSQLTIASADIGDLTVGSQFGPGQLTVLNGPPDFSPIGWIGSHDSADPVAITNIVGGLATTGAPHGLKVNDITLLAATTNALHNGYFVVATTPTGSTFTATGISGNSTGGTSTKQYQGGWLRTLAVGGTSPADAHFLADVDGSLTIIDALITLTGPNGTIVIDPSDPGITIVGSGITTRLDNSPVMGVAAGLVVYVTGGSAYPTQVSSGQLLMSETTSSNNRLELHANGSNSAIIMHYPSGSGSAVGIELQTGLGLKLRDTAGTVNVELDTSGDATFAGNSNAGGVYEVSGTQVVGPRLSAITAPTINTTVITQTAGATYTINEQSMLNFLKTAVNQLNTDVANLQTAVNDIRSRLSTHGLTA